MPPCCVAVGVGSKRGVDLGLAVGIEGLVLGVGGVGGAIVGMIGGVGALVGIGMGDGGALPGTGAIGGVPAQARMKTNGNRRTVLLVQSGMDVSRLRFARFIWCSIFVEKVRVPRLFRFAFLRDITITCWEGSIQQ